MDKEDKDVVFAPGSLDNFEGSQEELDALTSQITEQLSDYDFGDSEGKFLVMVMGDDGKFEIHEELIEDFKLDEARTLN